MIHRNRFARPVFAEPAQTQICVAATKRQSVYQTRGILTL
jgi:hypothetical protein